ncbi:PREDICTED: uncharacterized protein LOC109583336 [Amphimedon queenslandica]|uniref:Uncharacterized protein n=1 Tax=Amphimedon queenslandica TaxID=400682 RepID=A0A1X7UH84_AMPQE|nr:PREDICTED: uncharacterized protein LOC109583336 [Amphimedon queenslandica]|eukprot:XP_019854191.1 PREDICTED: uncharacterized protein LOC109583336 [Amphimedon queenslandica]
MGCCSSKNHSREGAEEAYEEPIITDNSDTIVTAIAESQLNNDEVTTGEVSLPIAATTNPLVTSSISQAEQYQTPERRETVTSRSAVPIFGDKEKTSSLITTSYTCRTPTMAIVARSLPLGRLESVNDEATPIKVEESMGKPRGPTALPNDIEIMEPPIHESPLTEYTEPTEATLSIQANSEEQLPSSSDTPPFSYQAGAVPETLRMDDVNVMLKDGDHGFLEVSLINHQQH